jgi:dihydrofolate synthase/folylpolyglutamate synthase
LALGGRAITLRTPFTRYEEILVSLHGIHQGVNAATAIVAAEAFLGRALGEEAVSLTLAKARMPGRMELISRRPMIVVDGAHNPAGVKALVATLDGAFHVAGERRCVLGMLSGRNIDDMVEPLVAYEHPSATSALAHARERSTDEDLIVVSGSLYLVAEVRGEVMRVRSRHLT